MNYDNWSIETFDSIQNRASKQEKFIASEVTHDGTIIEMLYEPTIGATALAIYKDGVLEIQRTCQINGVTLKPYPATKDFLKNNVILFPSEPTECGSQIDLIRSIQSFIRKYLSVSSSFEKIASYYVLFTWVYDDFNELPYLRGLGDFGTGKSRLLKVIGSICYRPISASGATTVSPIFRILNDFRGTLILDEADFKISDTTAEIIKILNSGFMKGCPVLRSESTGKKGFDVKSYNVFGPKIIATRFRYKDSALESRMITEDMNLNAPKTKTPYNLPNSFESESLEIRNRLLMYRFRNKGKFQLKPVYEDRTIEPRLNQISIPLMSIIEENDVILEIQNHIKSYNKTIKEDRTMDRNYILLEVICSLIDNGYKTPTMKEITDKYNSETGNEDWLKPRKVGFFIRKHLDLRTEKTRDGFILTLDNYEKIETLRKRFGIKRVGDSEHVNIVNVNSPLDKAYDDIPIINH